MWRLRYRIGNLEKQISLGLYPDVPLKRARQKRDEARRAAMLVTFKGVAQEWLEPQSKSLSAETIFILGARLSSGLYPYLGTVRPRSAATSGGRRVVAVGAVRNCLLTRSSTGPSPPQIVARSVTSRDRTAQRRCAAASRCGLRYARLGGTQGDLNRVFRMGDPR